MVGVLFANSHEPRSRCPHRSDTYNTTLSHSPCLRCEVAQAVLFRSVKTIIVCVVLRASPCRPSTTEIVHLTSGPKKHSGLLAGRRYRCWHPAIHLLPSVLWIASISAATAAEARRLSPVLPSCLVWRIILEFWQLSCCQKHHRLLLAPAVQLPLFTTL